MFVSLIFAAALTFTDAHAAKAYSCASTLVERHSPRDAGTVRSKIASNWILDTASAAGLNVRRDSFTVKMPQGRRRLTNLVAELKMSEDAPWIVLVSHYDTKTGVDCPGANDGASTSGLLIAIGEMLGSWRGKELPKANVMLVWTDGEECISSYEENDGLWGSRHAVAGLQRRGAKVNAAICLDMLGDEDLEISIPLNCDESLAAKVVKAADECGVAVKRFNGRITDDHVPFLEAGYPAVNLIDFEYSFWHTPEDTMEHVKEESLAKSGRLVAALLCDLMQ